jgi:hypothetical protein
MLYRGMAATLVLFLAATFARPESYTGVISKIEDGKVTFRTGGRRKGKAEGKEHTVKITKDTKITRAARKDGGEATTVSASDLKVALNVVGRVAAKIETSGEGDNETATSITIGGGFGKRKKGKAEE